MHEYLILLSSSLTCDRLIILLIILQLIKKYSVRYRINQEFNLFEEFSEMKCFYKHNEIAIYLGF